MINKTESGKWRVRIKYKGNVVADRTFERKGDGQQWEAEQKRLLDLGDWIDPKRGRETFASVAKRWLEMRETTVAEKTYQTDEYLLRLHVPDSLKRRPIGSIQSSDIAKLLVIAGTRLRAGSVTRFRAVLSALFAWAVRERILRDNPVESVPVPRGIGTNETTEIYPFSLAELLSVYRDLRVASGRWADLALVLGLTGIRWGELMALRTRDVQQLPYASLRVSRSAPDGKSVRNSTKGGKARVVPLADRLKPIFEEWSVGRRPDDLIFATPSGNPIGGSNWKRTVRWTELGRGRRVHDLRHSAATLWLSAGIDVKTVQTWLGHASMTLTVDTYAHWMGSDADVAAVSRINGILGDEKGTSLNPD